MSENNEYKFTLKDQSLSQQNNLLLARLNLIMNTLTLAIMYINYDKIIQYVNKKMIKFLNFPENKKITGEPYYRIIPEDPYLVCRKIIKLSFANKKSFKNQQIKLGSNKIVSLSTHYVSDHRQKGVVLTIKDTTRDKHNQLKMLENDKKLIREHIYSECFHEYKNLLSTMQANIQILQSRMDSSDPNYKYINNIARQVKSASSISRDFLQFVRSSNQVSPAQISIEKIIDEIKLMVMEELQQRNIELNIRIDDNIPSLYVDANKLKQILVNLIRNAREAVDRNGKIHIKANFLPPGQVQITVEDTGPGIPPDDLKKIFKPLYTTKDKGNGLGLAICKKLINSLRGTIKARNSERGACFSIKIPLNYRI